MKINRFLFKDKPVELLDEIDFSSETINLDNIRQIKKAKVKIIGQEYDDLLILDVTVDTDIIGICSYTLEDVPLHLHFKDTLEFSSEIEDDESIFFEPKPIFDIDPYILGLIVSETPTKIIKKGAKLPSSGDGYRVLSEEEYRQEQENKKDSRWSKLDDVEL